jgi:hypothetical protein
MSLLKSLKSDDTIANERDSVGGGGPLESNVYPAKVQHAYINSAASGAIGLVLNAKTSDGKEVRETLWMTSGKAKGCKNYYEKDGEKHYLPGYLIANSLALLTVGKEISELDTETKVINVYSYEAKAEVPTKVEMVMDLIGQDIMVGVIKEKVDKTQKNESTGEYVPTGETREQNVIDKLFRARDRMTVAEIRAQAEEASFIDTWIKKWSGQVRDKSGKAGNTGTAGAPRAAAPAGTKKPAQSLFA